jgi:HlyD family secretion protein
VAPDQLSQDLASLKIDRSPGAGGRSLGARLLPIVIVLAALGAIGWFVVYPKVTATFMTTEIRTGEIRLVSPAQAQVQLTATGYVVALTSAKVAAKVPGRIAEIYVEEGKTIEKGAPVARLEDVDFKSALAASRARGAAARAKIAIARANLAEIKTQLEREKPLVASGVTPKATLDDLQTHVDSLAAMVRAAEAEAAAADAETRSLDVQLGSYLITTPISGTVVTKLVQVGEGVSPGFGTPGVIEVVDMTSLVVEVDVPETRLSQVHEGGPCEIVLDAYSNQRFPGSVKEIGNRVNRAKATVPVKVKFDTIPPHTLPEMAARVGFLSEKADAKSMAEPSKLVVPASAVVKRNGRDVLFLYEDGEVRMTAVEVGPPFADGLELKTALPASTKIVLEPPPDLTDGQKVKEKK